VAADDAVVVAADQRASLGGRFTANKDVQKVLPVHPTAALAMSGSVGPVQDLARTLKAEAGLYAARRGEDLSMAALASVAGNLVRGIPAQLLLGGVDDAGAHVYELDGGGSVLPSEYAAAGSGMQVAYGVLEGEADAVADVSDARDLALRAIRSASERDTASGNGAHVATVTSDGVEVASRTVAELAGANRGSVSAGRGDER
jgi:proteasome beta subunit